MSKQLIERVDVLMESLEKIKSIAPLFPEASDEIRYDVVNGSVLIYIPYSLSILAQWQERLNQLGFTRDGINQNFHGITVHEDYDKDCCRMVNKELGISVALWLCPGHPMASVRKGTIPQL